jgi:hypothetical protein
METITQIEVTVIERIIVDRYWDARPEWQDVTDTFVFGSKAEAAKFAKRSIRKHSTVIVTDITDERDEVLFNSKAFGKVNDAKRACEGIK